MSEYPDPEKNPKLEPEDIERIQLFEACRQVEHHLRALGSRFVQVSIEDETVNIAASDWLGFYRGESLFDAIIAAKERSGA